jgi:hypothetical protein
MGRGICRGSVLFTITKVGHIVVYCSIIEELYKIFILFSV